MRTTLREKDTGQPVLEYIAAQGTWEDDFEIFGFPSAGRESFGLAGDELEEFVDLCVASALRNGIVPVHERMGEYWLPTYAYGITDDEIARNMKRAYDLQTGDTPWDNLVKFSWRDAIEPAAYAEWVARRRAAGMTVPEG